MPDLNILIKARDQASKAIAGVNRQLDAMGKHARRGAGEAIKNVGKIAVAGGALAVVLGAGAVKAAADFESQLNVINTVAQTSAERLEIIGNGIRKLARDTGTPLEELTQGFYDLVSAGIAADQAQRVLASSNKLAIGGLASTAETVDLITTALNSYGVAAQDQGAEAERFADIFAKAIERGKVTAADLAASFAQVGGIAANAGIEIEELAAAYAQMTAKGVPAAEASTAMTSAIIALTRRTGDLEKLEKATGKSYLAIAGKKGLVVALEELRVDAGKAGKPMIDLLGRTEALRFAVNTTGPNLATYNTNLEAMGDAAGAAQRQMDERTKGLNYHLGRLKAFAIDAGITIGSKLLPKLTPLAERAVAFLEEHEPDIERFGEGIADAFDRAAEFAAKIPWDAVGSGLRTAAEWAGQLMDVFIGLPPEVQTTIIALAGLNKLTGGAVGSIVSELGKGLIRGILGINAGVVNINAAVVNGGGIPGGPGGRPGSRPGVPGGGRGFIPPWAGRFGLLALPTLLAGDTPQGKPSDPEFLAMLQRMRAAGRGSEKISDTETVDQALERLTGVVSAGQRRIDAGQGRLIDRIDPETRNEILRANVEASKRNLTEIGSLRSVMEGIEGTIRSKDWSPQIIVDPPDIASYTTIDIKISDRDIAQRIQSATRLRAVPV